MIVAYIDAHKDRVVEGRRLGVEPIMLGCGARAAAGERHEAGKGGGQKDLRRPVGGEQARDEGPKPVGHTEQVHTKHAQPFVCRDLPRRPESPADDPRVQTHNAGAWCAVR